MKKLLIILCAALALCSCGTADDIADSDKPVIYTTFYAMYDFTREIAGDNAEVTQLIPSGTDAHDFEPTASDIAKLTKADALVYCGSGVDSYIDGIKETIENAGVQTLDTSLGVTLDGSDPHIWLSPENALIQYESIKNLMCKTDPENSAVYEQRFNDVSEKISELKRYLEDLKNLTVKKDIIVSHAAYGYLCNELGITENGIENSTVEGADPSAKQMADIITLANEKQIKYIFAQKGESDKTASAIAREINGSILYLDPFESDTGSGSYFDVMNENIQALGTALR